MKKALIFAGLAATALSLVGCNKEADLAVSGKKVEIVLSNVDTRTVNDGMSTVWAADDALTVFYAPAGTTTWSANTKFTVTDAASNKATGEVELTADSYDWYLFYPYTSQIPNPTGKNDAGEWTGYFYVGSSNGGSQTQAGLNSSAHIAGNRVPVVGRATAVPADQTPAVTMKHLSTLLKINVTNVYEEPVTITKVSFTAPVNIVGSAYMDFSGAEPVLVPSEGHIGKTAQLTVANADPLASGATASFYLAVMPFSIASGDLLTVDIVAEEGTNKAEVEVNKAYTFAAGKVKNLNVDFEVDTPIQAMTVTEAIAAADESSVTIGGAIVAALSTKGFIITDGTSNVYVYLNAAPTVAIGDEVTLSATLDADYYGLPEIKSVSSCKVTSSGNTVPYTTLVELDKDNIDDYDCTTAADYIAVTGTLEKSGSYYNVRPEGSSRYARTDYLISSINPSDYVGKKVTMKGYFNTLHSTGNYLKVVTTEFIPDDTPASALASIAVSGQNTSFTVGDTFSFGGTVTATYDDGSTKDVTSAATFDGYDLATAGSQTVTVSYTEGSITKTATYSITVSAVDGTTLSVKMGDVVEANGYTLSSGNDNIHLYTVVPLNASVRMSTSGKPNCGAFYTDNTYGAHWRLYEGSEGDVTFAVAEGCELKSVKIRYFNQNNGRLYDGENEISSNTKYNVSGSSVTYTVGHSSGDKNGQVRIAEVEIVYTGDGTNFPDNPVTPTVTETSISMASTKNVYVGETVALNATSNVPGAPFTYESEDPAIATVDANGIVTGVAEGSVKVWARISAVEGQYTAAERYTTVEVSTKPVETDGTEVFIFSELGYTNGADVTTVNGKNVTLVFAKGEGSNAPKYYDAGTNVRMYKNNTLTVSSEKTITKIEFFCPNENPVHSETTFSTGACSENVWTGSAKSVEMVNATSASAQIRFTSIKVTFE